MQPTIGDALDDSEVALEELTRCLGDLRQKDREIVQYRERVTKLERELERVRGLHAWQADTLMAIAREADDQRRQYKLAEAEAERMAKALRQCAYQRDNAVADKTIAQAVADKLHEEAKALRQQVEELRRQVKIG